MLTSIFPVFPLRPFDTDDDAYNSFREYFRQLKPSQIMGLIPLTLDIHERIEDFRLNLNTWGYAIYGESRESNGKLGIIRYEACISTCMIASMLGVDARTLIRISPMWGPKVLRDIYDTLDRVRLGEISALLPHLDCLAEYQSLKDFGWNWSYSFETSNCRTSTLAAALQIQNEMINKGL